METSIEIINKLTSFMGELGLEPGSHYTGKLDFINSGCNLEIRMKARYYRHANKVKEALPGLIENIESKITIIVI